MLKTNITVVREIDAQDEPSLLNAIALVQKVFDEFVAPDYSAEGQQEFGRYIEFDNIKTEVSAGRLIFWGAFAENTLAGVIAVRPPDHVSLLFVDGKWQHKGIASALFKEAKAYFAGQGCKAAGVNSSPYAVQAYQRLGFEISGEETVTNGIKFIPMIYRFKNGEGKTK